MTTPTTVTYLFTDLYGQRIEQLPLTGVTFELALNEAGQWSATLPIEDPTVRATNWRDATAPNLACVWVYFGATLVYGGLVRTRKYSMASQTVKLAGADFCCYMDQLLQAKDYSTTWQDGAGTATMAAQILTDALAQLNTLPITTSLDGTEPSEYWISASFPLSQQQAISSIFQQLQEMGYLVGFDYACDVYQTSGVPTAEITLSYPRRGRPAGTTSLAVDIASAVDFTYDEDGTSQANQVQEMATSGGGVGATLTWQDSLNVGYPFLQAVEQHAVFSAQTFYTSSEVAASQAVLNAWGADDLALHAYPAIAPTITVPLYGEYLQLGDFISGDDLRVIIGQTQGLPTNPRFPNGLDYYFRIIKAAVKIADEGLSTMTLTLNLPPSSTPQRPPT